MAEYGNPEHALARLKCAHCQSLVDCEALALEVIGQLRRRYQLNYRRGDGISEVTDSELVATVRGAIDCFFL